MKRSLTGLCIGLSTLLGLVTSSEAEAQDLAFVDFDVAEEFDLTGDVDCHEDFQLEGFEFDQGSVQYSTYYERYSDVTLTWADACQALQKEKDELKKMIKLEKQNEKNAKESGDAAAEFQAFAAVSFYEMRLAETESALDACREMFSKFFN